VATSTVVGTIMETIVNFRMAVSAIATETGEVSAEETDQHHCSDGGGGGGVSKAASMAKWAKVVGAVCDTLAAFPTGCTRAVLVSEVAVRLRSDRLRALGSLSSVTDRGKVGKVIVTCLNSCAHRTIHTNYHPLYGPMYACVCLCLSVWLWLCLHLHQTTHTHTHTHTHTSHPRRSCCHDIFIAVPLHFVTVVRDVGGVDSVPLRLVRFTVFVWCLA
jgi:hypothetical protein